ncbi:hypothetical protein [Clostridium tagluense]|uniref:Uncharacterized protein n=1 Tax=Clostridium tagluense TaxID=360422 RepID=A0A401US85_9CLOT|nr:hypothetical protein [Clostridium tagluense]GCD12397.1 hypothetical protein Ctaglu_40200 [Clostridium tagluense]
MKNKFDFNTGAITDISEDKMTIEEYREYVKSLNSFFVIIYNFNI